MTPLDVQAACRALADAEMADFGVVAHCRGSPGGKSQLLSMSPVPPPLPLLGYLIPSKGVPGFTPPSGIAWLSRLPATGGAGAERKCFMRGNHSHANELLRERLSSSPRGVGESGAAVPAESILQHRAMACQELEMFDLDQTTLQ